MEEKRTKIIYDNPEHFEGWMRKVVFAVRKYSEITGMVEWYDPDADSYLSSEYVYVL